MKNKSRKQLTKEIRMLILFFIAALFISGLTAFPIETELQYANNLLQGSRRLAQWIGKCYFAIKQTNIQFPFLAYGTDWLAFSHIILAILFIGPLKDPVRNIWIIKFGFIACAGIIPLAIIAGHIREIPFFWQLIDMSFGIVGIIPLWLIYKRIHALERK